MFRRSGKGQEKENLTPLYKDEGSANYLFKKGDEVPPRIFDPPSSIGTPPDETGEERRSLYEKTLSHHPFHSRMVEEPETTLGEGVTFRGQLSFDRLLRIDGTFEGELLSQGKVIIGPKGKVKANLNLREAVIEGRVEGNVTIQERLELRGEASVLGDIRAKNLIVDEGVTIMGLVEVVPNSENKPL